MADTIEFDQQAEGDDARQASTKMPLAAAFTGYRPFPPVMNLYANYSGIFKAVSTHKLCGASADDMLYLVEVHFGYTPRGPLHFGRGLYLRNGTKFRDPILAAAGEVFRLPLLVSLFSPKTAILLPPLDTEKHPGNKITELLHASASKEHSVAFKFAIEVGVAKLQREEFEWRKIPGKEKAKSGHEKGSWFKLYRVETTAVDSPHIGPSISAASPSLNDDSEVLAELRFEHLMSFKHLFALELKGAGRTGELGERWTLMVVMTALGIHWLRQNGKTRSATVKVAQKFASK